MPVATRAAVADMARLEVGADGCWLLPSPGPYGLTIPDPKDYRHVDAAFACVPQRLMQYAGATYEFRWREVGRRDANGYAESVRDYLLSEHVEAVASEESVQACATARALEVRRLLSACVLASNATVRAGLLDILNRWGIPAPRVMLPFLVARLSDAAWWRRAIRRHVGRRVETWAQSIGAVHRRAGLYCSDDASSRWVQRQGIAARYVGGMEAVNEETGECVSLADAVESSVSNPELRRGELMTRIAGFEKVAVERGDVGLFVTLTCPSRMHSHLHDGTRNPKWDGSNPKVGQAHMQSQWARLRAWASRREVGLYGFRIAEPHHDGSPHWHMLLFVAPRDVQALTDRMRYLALLIDGDEAGAAKHRFTAKRIDPEKGTAAGYIAKYVAKNIDGFNVGADDEAPGVEAMDSSARVRAWASTWGIRQFQQIGGPGVGVWRELRRVRAAVDSPLLESLRGVCDAGDWCGFVSRMGGPTCKRADRPASLWSVQRPGRVNAWGENEGPRVVGVACLGAVAISRPVRWVLRSRGSNRAARVVVRGVPLVVDCGSVPLSDAAGREAAKVRAQIELEIAETQAEFSRSGGGLGVPRTRGNNCTGADGSPPGFNRADRGRAPPDPRAFSSAPGGLDHGWRNG